MFELIAFCVLLIAICEVVALLHEYGVVEKIRKFFRGGKHD